MPKDEWGNIISESEYNHIYHSNGIWFPTKDEFGNIIHKDENGNIKSEDN